VSRALEKYFGREPDLDIEAQRAIVVLKKPMKFDWKKVDQVTRDANYTFGGAHLRVRGRVVQVDGVPQRLAFEFKGSGDRIPVVNEDVGRGLVGRDVTMTGRIENWSQTTAIVILTAE
jgi:hypothetical protein